MLVEDLNTLLNTKYVGKKNLSIEEISSIKNASKNSVIFVSQISQINIKNIYKAGVILTSKDIAKCLPNSNILIADNPKLQFAKLTNIFFKIKNNKKDWKPFYKKSPLITGKTQSQGQTKFYHPNGVAYCLWVGNLNSKCKSIYENAHVLVNERFESFDIDTKDDLNFIKKIV